MRRVLPGLVLILGGVMLAPASHAATMTGMTSATARDSVLYRSDFKSKGLKGWTRYAEGTAVRSSWHVGRNGILLFDGSANGAGEAQAPVSIAHLTDFAVQAQIKAVGQPTSVFSGFGVVARNAQPAGFRTDRTTSGVMGGFYSSPGGAGLVWYPDEVGGEAATLHPGYNTFRVEVHGSDYSLLINGQLIVSYPITPSRTGARVGLWGLSQLLQVKSFEVLRLSSASPLPSVTPIKALALGPEDAPGGFLLAGRDDYYTVAEWARHENVSTAVEAGREFVVGFSASYVAPGQPATGAYLIYSEIQRFASPQSAHASWSIDWASTATRVQTEPFLGTNYASGDITGVGDEAHWFSADVPEPYYGSSFQSTELGISFRRGAYEVLVAGGFVAGTMSHDAMLKQVLAWAQMVDRRSQ